MRELDFLPGWYNQLLQRRRQVLLLTWTAIAVAFAMGTWISLAEGIQIINEKKLDTLRNQLAETHSQLEQMDRLELLRKQWLQQAEVLSRMGIHVESGRLIGKLAEVMPPALTFLELGLETEEKPVQLSGTAAAAMKEPPAHPLLDRRLRVRIKGVAPTDVELATFLTELNKVPYFEQVAPTYVRDRRQSGHVLREFELLFQVNLNMPAGG